MSPEWDVFISHASEDKESVARPLAEELTRRGLRVWYDETTLRLGDSLRKSIDYGLARSRFGVVILSRAFFAKEWPQRELDGISTRELRGEKVLLPVWHGVDWNDVLEYSAPLADRLAVPTTRGIDQVASRILDVVRSGTPTWRAVEESSASQGLTVVPLENHEMLPGADLDYASEWGVVEFYPNPIARGQVLTVKLRLRPRAWDSRMALSQVLTG